MAGAASEDNPVGINVTAMVDIIFCLCIFFMCSFHFKQLQGSLDSWLPKEVGPHAAPTSELLEELRVTLEPDPAGGPTITRVGARRIGSEAELLALIADALQDYAQVGKSTDDVPIIIDARSKVPWRDVIDLMNACKGKGYKKIQFAAPLPAAALPG